MVKYTMCVLWTYWNGVSWQELGISILESAIRACVKEIEMHKGKLTVKEAPRAVHFIH
jgi:hypothetical protein